MLWWCLRVYVTFFPFFPSFVVSVSRPLAHLRYVLLTDVIGVTREGDGKRVRRQLLPQVEVSEAGSLTQHFIEASHLWRCARFTVFERCPDTRGVGAGQRGRTRTLTVGIRGRKRTHRRFSENQLAHENADLLEELV